jgi:outer membrane lipoprotein-sorting protein
MRLKGLVGAITGLAVLAGVGATPAAAQDAAPDQAAVSGTMPSGLPIEMVLMPPKRPADPSPAQAAAPAPMATASADPAAPVAYAAGRAAAPAPAAQPSPQPIVTAATPANARAARSEPLSQREIVDRANAYFNSLGTLVADFTQIGGDGRRLGGTLYLQRPGKLRFDFDAPATLEVIADGSSVAVRDRKLATQDLYSISQTPLKFLLRERVNLGQDLAVTGVANDGDAVRLSLEDRSTFGGTSRITLFFDPQVETLTQWRIVDPQGFQTTVMLNKADRTKRVDQRLFVINYDRPINTERSGR